MWWGWRISTSKSQIFNLVMKFVYVLCVFCVMYGLFNAINDFDSSSRPLVQHSVWSCHSSPYSYSGGIITIMGLVDIVLTFHFDLHVPYKSLVWISFTIVSVIVLWSMCSPCFKTSIYAYCICLDLGLNVGLQPFLCLIFGLLPMYVWIHVFFRLLIITKSFGFWSLLNDIYTLDSTLEGLK